jgi:hypothetical protein
VAQASGLPPFGVSPNGSLFRIFSGEIENSNRSSGKTGQRLHPSMQKPVDPIISLSATGRFTLACAKSLLAKRRRAPQFSTVKSDLWARLAQW